MIIAGVNKTKDSDVLDRVLALLTSAVSSLQVEEDDDDEDILRFDICTQFAPAQKNETQLKFHKKKRRKLKQKKKIE